MADYKKTISCAKNEITIYFWDLTDRLPDGITVSSATGAHVPPSGAAITPSYSVASPVVSITVPALTGLGVHTVESLATLSDGEVASLLLLIPVRW